MPVENCEIIFFLNVDALADMLVYDENHSPEMIKGRGKYQLPKIPTLHLPRASPNSTREPEDAELVSLGSSGPLQGWAVTPSPSLGTATPTCTKPTESVPALQGCLQGRDTSVVFIANPV